MTHTPQTFADALLTWFETTKRVLPWRRQRTPYRIWVAEVMLQQTQVTTVAPYFERWMARFSSLEALAHAPLDDVLKLWEGLGYYRRARLLHRAAQQALAGYGGVPATSHELLKLPGVGHYTAAAVASIAFGEDIVAVDGNVKRVAARLFRLAGEVALQGVTARLTPLLPPGQAGAFNEAMMELGATVCTPKTPACHRCPVTAYCQAFQTGEVTRFPTPKVKRPTPHVEAFALVRVCDGALWLRQRDVSEMLGGLWGFPLQQAQPAGEPLPSVRHAYTHFTIRATPVLVACDTTPAEGRLVALAEVGTLALSKLDHKILSVYRTYLEGHSEQA